MKLPVWAAWILFTLYEIAFALVVVAVVGNAPPGVQRTLVALVVLVGVQVITNLDALRLDIERVLLNQQPQPVSDTARGAERVLSAKQQALKLRTLFRSVLSIYLTVEIALPLASR
jgi:hypothetical protein